MSLEEKLKNRILEDIDHLRIFCMNIKYRRHRDTLNDINGRILDADYSDIRKDDLLTIEAIRRLSIRHYLSVQYDNA